MRKYLLDGERMQSIESAHRYLKACLGFPEHYGKNLDALADCLSELGQVQIELINADKMLENDRKYAERLLQVFEEVSARMYSFVFTMSESRVERGVYTLPNEQLFTSKADDYAASRPSYAAAAIDLMLSQLRQGDRVADIGSGTGIMSREFVKRGYQTFCVEPNEAMRSKAEQSLGEFENFVSVNSAAEDTGIEAHSVKLICAASSFHWFDTEAFKKECERILTENGEVFILINVREYDDFTKLQHEICKKYCKSFTSLAHGFE